MKRKPYIGITKDNEWYGFSTSIEPIQEDYPEYVAVIGAFTTRRAQLWALKYGKYNPHFTHVIDAERFAKKEMK